MRTQFTVMAALAASLALAACGGGRIDYEAPAVTPMAPPTDVPSSAITSSGSLVGYLNVLAADDSSEPLNLPAGDVATTETEEAITI